MGDSEREWVLREFDLFRDLSDAEVERIGAAAPMSQLPVGQMLYSPGRHTEVLFILKKGRIRLFQIGIDGRTMTTGIISPGQIFGEMAVLGQHLDQTHAETLEPCVVCLMSRADVERLLLSDSRIATRVAEFLGSRVAELERRLGDSVLKSAPERIAATLARLAGEEGQMAAVRLTHEQLADLVGTSRETATKVLGDLSDRGLVSLRRGRMLVRDPAALRDLAEGGDLGVATGGYRPRKA
ncbi:MAG: Crp/Fnr family transcriptional regulator [Candidatus Nanopelagicales bacterium]|nr:Crp/Fnr family transcriptional regulator [Candidatus Nanopelagicales bacterium]